MYIAFHLTFHSNIVNNNMFQYLIMFIFCKQFLLNAVITRISFYYATIAYHVGLNAVPGLPHPGPTS